MTWLVCRQTTSNKRSEKNMDFIKETNKIPLAGDYIVAFKNFNDSIGCTGHWLKPGIVYEIPYRTMVVQDFPNILAVGRIISASRDAWEATRVIPPAVLTGQAAGTAAAMAIKKKCTTARVPVAELQKNLQDAGVILHYQN